MSKRERGLATIAAIFTMACAHPPKPPHPAFPEASSLEDADAGTELVAEAKASPIDPAVIPLVPPTALPTEPTPATVDAGAAPDAAKLAGAATLVGDYAYDSGRSGVRKSIDAVVDEMSVLARGIARRRLVDANAVPKKVAIRQDGTEVTVQIDKKAYVATLGGGSRRVRDPNGEVSRMRLVMRGDSLYQTFHTDQGDRTNVFTVRDGGGLTMAVRITSPQLPADVRYRLGFDRS
jgi:hypothetical protein